MMIGRVQGATRVLGKSQGFRGLPVRDDVIHCNVSGENTPVMVTAWEPTPAELVLIAAGAPVLVYLQGQHHPPIIVSVGEVPK